MLWFKILIEMLSNLILIVLLKVETGIAIYIYTVFLYYGFYLYFIKLSFIFILKIVMLFLMILTELFIQEIWFLKFLFFNLFNKGMILHLKEIPFEAFDYKIKEKIPLFYSFWDSSVDFVKDSF